MVVQRIAPRNRKVRVLATLGPSSRSPEMIRKLLLAGADAFRINMSHGTHEQQTEVVAAIRALEKELGRPTTILVDLQGPKLRVGDFAEGIVQLRSGQRFTFDRDPTPGDAKRVELPHRELFEALKPRTRLLLDDGKIELRVDQVDADQIVTRVRSAARCRTTRASTCLTSSCRLRR
jgi:pyruvate kinase